MENSVSDECMACDETDEEEEKEAEYETCEEFKADWGPDGAERTEEVIEEGKKCMEACSTGTCGGAFDTAIGCIVAAIREECPGCIVAAIREE